MTADRRLREIKLGEQLALLISSEITVKVLVILVERAASPSEIARKLGLKTPAVSHHVKKLERMNLIELIEEREVGGAIQHVYRAVVRPIVSNDEWEKLSPEEQERFSIWIVQMLIADLARSFQGALFDAHPKNHLSRTPMVVDIKGLEEVASIMDRALSEIFDAEANASGRLAKSGESGINLISSMMCFQIPGPTEGLDTPRAQPPEAS